MANPIPTLMCSNFKGSGDLGVYKLLNGITLDPVQDGSNVLTGGLEVTPDNTTTNIHANRLIESAGNRFLLHGLRVYERDEGGSGLWGEVTSLGLSATSTAHSGLHVLHDAGVPTLAFLCIISNVLHVVSSNDGGASWSDINTSQGVIPQTIGRSVVYRQAIYWIVRDSGNGTRVQVYDFQTDSASELSLPDQANLGPHSDIYVHKNKLYVSYTNTSSQPNLARLDGASFTLISASPTTSTIDDGSAMVLFSDGDDLILVYPPDTGGVPEVFRYTDPTSVSNPAPFTDISSAWSGISGLGAIHGWSKYVSSAPDPEFPTVYLWLNEGGYNTGTYNLYRYRYRQIAHGSVTGGPFTLGEFVEQSNSGARGRIMESDGSSLDLTDVSGTFNNTDTITGDDSGAFAAATSLLTEQAPVSIGPGISAANYGIVHEADGGLARIPVKGAARPSWDGQPIEEISGVTRWYFRVYGSGSAVDLSMYIDDGERAPDFLATLVNASLIVESGSPATTPTITNGASIDNVTPDDGATLYSFQHDADTDNIAEGQGFTAFLDLV